MIPQPTYLGDPIPWRWVILAVACVIALLVLLGLGIAALVTGARRDSGRRPGR